MNASGLDALVCRLPENVVYLTDYWPHHGFSVAVFPSDGQPILFIPEVEEEYGNASWCEITPFGWGLVSDCDLYESYRDLFKNAKRKLGLRGRIGIEKSFEIVGPSYRWAEPVVPSQPWSFLLGDVFRDCEIVDATDFVQSVRSVKSSYELAKLHVANEIAQMGMETFLSCLRPDMTEAQVGAMVEARIRGDGPGYKGARLVRAMAEVGTGPEGSTKDTLLVPSTTRIVREGDIVMVELATCVDGYWSDLTYCAVAGTPNARQRDVYNTVLEAQRAAAQELRPGACFSAPDTVARDVLSKEGLEKYFVHITGHGVGLRYHESIPMLMPGATGLLREGMVASVEPGVYIQDFGGIRIEDNVAVGPKGPVFLSVPRGPW